MRAEEFPEVVVPEGYEPPDASLPYVVNGAPKQPMGMIVNIPLNGSSAGMNFTMVHLESAMEEMRQAGVPSDAALKVWYDQDCRDLGLPIGPAMRIRAMWMSREEEARG